MCGRVERSGGVKEWMGKVREGCKGERWKKNRVNKSVR